MTTSLPTGAELTKLLREAVEIGALPKNLQGQTVVFTGTLSMKRDDLKVLVRAAGGRTEDTIRVWGYRTTLVVGDTGRHGETAKISKARSSGVKLISEADLVQQILGT